MTNRNETDIKTDTKTEAADKIKSAARKTTEKTAENRSIAAKAKKTKELDRSGKALDKIYELINCGDRRIELSSAKELISLLGLPYDENKETARLEVEIKVV